VLAEYFGRRMASEMGWDRWPGFTGAAAAALEKYQWPGNVRELRNVIERAVYRSDTPDAPIADITFDPFDRRKPTQSLRAADNDAPPAVVMAGDLAGVCDLRGAVDAHEKAIVEAALPATGIISARPPRLWA
jgi:psp operon transcriptional activator